MTLSKIWPSPKIVVIGGGTGTSTILSGLKKYTDNINAVISVMDDGGSTGRLRRETGLLAMGDLRNCIVSLSDSDELMTKLLNYRFDSGELKGHNFGNLFIAAMYGITGDFNETIYETSNILKIQGRVFPITLTDAHLVAHLSNGTTIVGESSIADYVHENNLKINKITTQPERVEIFEMAADIIEGADLIILGPGSLYTSIIPNLVVKGTVEAIEKSKAKVIYVSNIMGQYGESENYTLLDHYKAICQHGIGERIDYIIANNGVIDSSLLERYRKEGASQVIFDQSQINEIESKGIKTIITPLVRVKNGVIRHDTEKLSDLIINKILRSKDD